MREVRFGTEPLPCDLRLRHVIFAPLIVYGVLNLTTFAALMFGPFGMRLDPFWHAPLIFFLNF